jgi:type IV pilus assembly protein PilQ
MATTPLKTASRALSLATILVAGLAAWALGTQGSVPRDHRATSGEEPRQVSFAAVSTASSSGRVQSPLADDALLDEVSEPARKTKSGQRSQPRIQPDLARLSNRAEDSAAREKLNRDDLDIGDVVRNSEPAVAERRPAAVFRPANVEPESSRVETQLTAMQRQLQQLAQVQSEQKSNDQQRALELLQQIQQQKQADQIERLLQELQDAKKKGSADAGKPDETKPEAAVEERDKGSESAGDDEPPAAKKPGFMQAKPSNGDQERFESIEFHEAEIGDALAMLGQLSGMNILIGRGVTGRVPAANLQNVTAEQALDALTRSLGYVYEKEENFVFVWTSNDALARKQAARKSMSKVYRPRYISVKELQTLVTPLLSKPNGLIAVTNPAESGLEESKTKVGGNSLAQSDALLVMDFPEVIAQIDAIVCDIDVPPAQVVIEAMILSVKLTDAMKLGVNFAILEGQNKQLITSGSSSQINSNVGFPNKDSILPVMGEFLTGTAGLKYGFLQGDLSGFVEALETLAETSVVASPSVRVLNKQRAELIIGQRLGYKTVTQNGAQSVENINFLEVGTKLLIRPFVAEDGLVRMEIHPERSDGQINEAGLPESRTTEVTSNVMIRDGSTIVIGGLIEEQANQSQSRIPGLGALPVVGNLFKNKANDTNRTELIVLITPRVVRDFDAEVEGDLSRSENERRHQEFRDKLSPINRHNLARVEYERAARYFDEGDAHRAKRHIDEALRHNRNDLDALRLREQINAALTDKNWFKKMRRKPAIDYHRVPSAPTSAPTGEAIFEQEIPVLVPAPAARTLVPPAPAAAPEPLPPPPVPANDSAAVTPDETR